MSLRLFVNTDVRIFAVLRWTYGVGFFAVSPPRVDLREMSERRRSAAALSSRAHAFSVEALIGSNKKRKLRGWEEKELELSMESLATDGEDPAHCLDMDPGQCANPAPHRQHVRISVIPLQCNPRVLSQNMASHAVTQPDTEATHGKSAYFNPAPTSYNIFFSLKRRERLSLYGLR